MTTLNKFEHVSYTQFHIASNCMKLWGILYPKGKERVRSQKTQDAIFGSFMHEVYASMNRYIKSLKNKNTFGMEDIEKIYAGEFKKVSLSLEDYHTGWKSMQKYALETFNQRAEILLVEEKLTLELLDGDDGVALVAILDRVDEIGDALKVIDYKLSPLVPSYSEVEHDLQLNIYGYILSKLYPGKQIFFEKYSMTAGKGVKAAMNAEVQSKLPDYMTSLRRKMKEETEYKPTRCSMCQYCPEPCDIYKQYLHETYEVKGIKTLQQAVEAYEQVSMNFNIMKKERENLKEYIEKAVEKSHGEALPCGKKTVSISVGSRSKKEIKDELICKDCKAILPGMTYFNQLEIVDVSEIKKDCKKKTLHSRNKGIK